MGVSDHGKPLALDHGKWVPIFLRAVGEKMIRSEGYLCSRAANGELACKACGRYLPPSVPFDAHLRGHLAELDHYLEITREENKEAGKEKAKKTRTTKRVIAKQEKALAGLAVEYTPEELALLEEFGV